MGGGGGEEAREVGLQEVDYSLETPFTPFSQFTLITEHKGSFPEATGELSF